MEEVFLKMHLLGHSIFLPATQQSITSYDIYQIPIYIDIKYFNWSFFWLGEHCRLLFFHSGLYSNIVSSHPRDTIVKTYIPIWIERLLIKDFFLGAIFDLKFDIHVDVIFWFNSSCRVKLT